MGAGRELDVCLLGTVHRAISSRYCHSIFGSELTDSETEAAGFLRVHHVIERTGIAQKMQHTSSCSCTPRGFNVAVASREY